MSYSRLINSLKTISKESPHIKVPKLLNYHLYKPNPFEGSPLTFVKGQVIKLKSEAFNATFQSNPKSEFYDNIPLPKTLHRHVLDPNFNLKYESPVGRICGLKIQAKGRRGSRSMTFSVGHGRLGLADHSKANVDFAISDFVSKMGSTGVKVTIGYS